MDPLSIQTSMRCGAVLRSLRQRYIDGEITLDELTRYERIANECIDSIKYVYGYYYNFKHGEDIDTSDFTDEELSILRSLIYGHV